MAMVKEAVLLHKSKAAELVEYFTVNIELINTLLGMTSTLGRRSKVRVRRLTVLVYKLQ